MFSAGLRRIPRLRAPRVFLSAAAFGLALTPVAPAAAQADPVLVQDFARRRTS